ncbi:hypothetical protein [Yinghuangia sp. YIM S09857]|uniref:hypothetical protein n=1 Tax=Yinghuangia sp. YIM S09857 TaxID=3436929 RepID=UPI003F5359DE
MTGRDEGQWMRERFELGVGDLPDSSPPHEVIVRRGRARRRTRNAVAGSVASVLVVAGLVAGFTMPGDDGKTSTATEPVPPPPPASSAAPGTTGAASPGAPGMGRVTLASDKLAEHTWELVRVRTQGEYEEDTYVLPGQTATVAPERHQGYCESFELVLDGTRIGEAGKACGDTPDYATSDRVPGQVNFLTVEVDDKHTRTGAGFGTLGAISWGFVTPDVDHVRVTFKDTGQSVDLPPQSAAGVSERFYLLVVPHSTGTDRRADLVAYDTAGRPVAEQRGVQVSAD